MRVLAAWSYYCLCVLRNRASSFLRRLKRPRNLIGLVLVVAYFWFFVLRFLFASELPAEGSRDTAKWILTAFFYVQLQGSWFLAGFGRGLVFRESEIQILFPAPVARRDVLLFKWLQVQFGLVIFALVAALAVGRVPGAHPLFAGVAVFVAANFFYLHSVFMSITLLHVRARLGGLVALVPGLLLLGGVALCAAHDWRESTGAGLDAIAAGLESGALALLTTPFRMFAAPVIATGAVDFARAMIAPFALLALQAWLVVRADLRIEDQAVATAQKVTRFKTEGMAAFKRPSKLVVPEGRGLVGRLAETGPAWRALVWKNLLSIGRIDWNRLWIVVLAILPIIAIALGISRGEGGDWASAAGLVILVLLFYACLLGPALIRVDLRLDIPHFDVIKAMPIRGREVIAGEILASVFVLFFIEICMLATGLTLFTGMGEERVTWSDKLPYALGAIPALFALTFAMVTAENLMALYFPSFVRLGRGMKAGFEQFGQNLLGAVFRFLGFMVLLLFPGLAAGAVVLIGTFVLERGPHVVAPLGATAFAFVLLVESLILIVLSEPRYERFDLSSEQLAVE